MPTKFFIRLLLAMMFFFFFYSIKANDSLKVQSLLDEAYYLEIQNPDSALLLYSTAMEIANEIGYKMGEGRAIQYSGIVQSDQGKYDEAILLYLEAIAIFNEIPYKVGVASTYNNIGNIYKRKAEYSKALENYLSAVRVFEDAGDTARLIYAYGNVGAILYDVEQYSKSLDFNRKALLLSQQIGDSISMCDKYINIGMIKMKQDQLDSASLFFDKTLAIANKINDQQSLYLVYNNYSGIASLKGNEEKALVNALRSIDYAMILNNPAYLSNAYTQTGANFIILDRLDSAEYFLNKGRELAELNEANEVLTRNYRQMSYLEEKKGDLDAALDWLKKYQEIEVKSRGEQQKRLVAGLEIEYESEKKDLELSEKALEIEKNEALLSKRNYLIVTLSGALISLFILFFLIRRGLSQKKIIAEKEAQIQLEKVSQLKKKQQVIALEAMMEGEEKERSRLAKDLHDGLGGMLSSAKMHFSSIASQNENLAANPSYEKAIDLLDQTSKEARKISHNLMPAALEKYGLIEALKDFCEGINSKALDLSFQDYGFEGRLPENTEVMIYRIVLELINNVLKHANATELLVQLVKNENQLHITIEDNGKGFDEQSIENEGIGLRNIRSRVKYLNGKIEIDSEKDKGSSINIEFAL